MSDRNITTLNPGDRALADLARRVRALEARQRGSSGFGGTMHSGTATIDFGIGTQEASIAVAGQGSIGATSMVKAWIGGTTVDNDDDSHLVAADVISLVIESLVANVGFTIRGYNRDRTMTKTFNVYWEWF